MSEFYAATDKGLVREINEDSLCVFSPEVYVVADGMGGHAAGEVASRLLVETVQEELEGQVALGEDALRQAVLTANERILACERNNPHERGMGTTATLLHIEGGHAIWAHVGDSRLYLLREGRLSQITRDHSVVAELVAMGAITEEEAEVHAQRNMITRAVGYEPVLDVDTGVFSLKDGDVLLLATDGLTKMLHTPELIKVLEERKGDCAKELLAQAIAAGGRDNITAIVVVFAA